MPKLRTLVSEEKEEEKLDEGPNTTHLPKLGTLLSEKFQKTNQCSPAKTSNISFRKMQKNELMFTYTKLDEGPNTTHLPKLRTLVSEKSKKTKCSPRQNSTRDLTPPTCQNSEH